LLSIGKREETSATENIFETSEKEKRGSGISAPDKASESVRTKAGGGAIGANEGIRRKTREVSYTSSLRGG